MPAISIVVITFNSEKYIDEVLKSAQKISSDIVVVDSFSTDNTEDICKRYTDKFYQKEFLGYSIQKNFGHSKAKNDWILSLDSDEVLSDGLIASIKDLKLSDNRVFALSRLNYYCGDWLYHGAWTPDYHVRIFNKQLSRWNEEEKLHETLVHTNNPKIIKVEGKLLHYSYLSLEDHFSKMRTYAQLFADQNKHQQKNIGLSKMLFNPIVKFIKSYFLKLGFLDGIRGFVLAVFLSFETFYKYAFAYFKRFEK